MPEAFVDRLASATGLVSYVVVGLVAGLSDLAGKVPVWWWVAYAVGLMAFAALTTERIGRRAGHVLLVVLFVAALLTYLMAQGFALSAVPMIVFVAIAAFVLPVWATLCLIGIQTAVLVVAGLVQTGDDGLGIAVAVMYAVFQLFALVMVESSVQERRMRDELAVANDELARAQTRLAESSKVEERLRISRDLHDRLGHQLSALAVNLEVASHLAQGSATEPVERSRVIAKDLLADVRGIVGQLRKPPVQLREALQDMADAVPSPQVRLDVQADLGALRDDAAEVVLRCVQEIITNAMRHAEATHLWITITAAGDQLVLTARDDGRGAREVVAGHGLTGMRERLSRLGGELHWDGSDGFCVEARMGPAA